MPEGACVPEWVAQKMRQRRARGDNEWLRVVAGAEHPSWAKHFINLLRDPLLKLKIRHGDSIRLVMWSDCAGKCTEKCAANEIAVQLKEELSLNIEFYLYAACDNTNHCQDFIRMNYDPPHFAHDIWDRNFQDGTFNCIKCKQRCSMPQGGFDIYFCCSPCGPWSRLGQRHGLDDPNGEVVWQTIRTIKHLSPVMFIMENVMEIGNSSNDAAADDMTKIKQFMERSVGDLYHIMTVSNISPIQQGYPTEKKRIIVVGARTETVVRQDLTSIFNTLISNPVPVDHTYWTFLGLESIAAEVADGIGALPGPMIASLLHSSTCTCSLDPYVLCAQHPCVCNLCKKNPGSTSCTWRSKAAKFITDH